MKKQSPKIINAKLASIWSKEKLRNIAPLRGGFAFKSEKFQNTGIPIVRISNIKFDGTVGGEFEYYSKIIPDEKFVLRGRSILLAMSGATTGKIAMLDSEGEYYQNQRVGYFQNTGEVDYDFLSSVLQTKAFTNQLNGVLVAGAQPNISSKEIDSFEFCIPDSIDEQSAIGSLFRTLDDLLASYKDNLINYQSLKATMLSKMFPKAGQTVPEIRLDGFEDEWEKGTIGEFGSFYYGKSAPKWSVTDEATTPCVRYGELYTKFSTKIDKIYSYTSIPKENLKLSSGNEVLVPRVGENPLDFANCSWLSLKGIAIGEMISVYNTPNNPLFIAYYFNAKMKKEFAKRVEGGSVANLYYTYLENISISVPSIPEQQAIGAYFSNLDNIINSHQEKISQLETLKKKLLQDMFI
ncbi:restriction endonuclease subunit S [Streptococcus mitis]|uniref:restriction endonuclease subunit S n=1 Tax=Streptococcus mitis TaxID=28037 RepID=UPI0021B51909|nr:restriction endonuclease subunit S [Streptococcus mitis]